MQYEQEIHGKQWANFLSPFVPVMNILFLSSVAFHLGSDLESAEFA